MLYMDNGRIAVKQQPKESEKKLPFILPPARFGAQKYLGTKTFIEVSDGYLVSFNGGENASKLFWYSKNGQENDLISKNMIMQFIKRDDKIYAIEGSTNGSVLEIKKQGNKWTATENTKLPSSPDAIGIDDNKNFIIVTTDNIIQVNQDGTIKTLLKEGFWSIALYPNSLFVKGDLIYVGMRKGVLRFNRTTKKQEWLMKD